MTPSDLIADLTKPWRHGEHLDARGAVFEEAVILDGLSLRGFDLSGAHFKSGLSAKGARFQGLAWLINAKIDADCDLSGAQFRIDLRADGLATQALRLDQAHVRGVLSLARLSARHVSLTRALIMANLTLEKARLSDGIDFSGTEIMGGFWADGAQLGDVVAKDCDLHGRRRHWIPDRSGYA